MTELYFSRLSLKRDPCTAALKALIDPPATGRRTDAHHRLLWTLFADNPDRDRDFLWRAEPRGHFYVLSRRPPQRHGLFEEPEVKPFEPDLAPGDRLTFMLRANAVRSVPGEPAASGGKKRKRGRKVDVAMHLLKDVPARSALPDSNTTQRAAKRHALAQEAGCEWMERQGKAHGFSLQRFVLEDYSTVTLPAFKGKRGGGREPRFGVFDMKGEIAVTDPAAFLTALAAGFGRARAYGCGLMMIRRA